jgi:hypothetical protein
MRHGMTFTTLSGFRLSQAAKTVWIFGAGASSCEAYNVPIQGKILERFTKLSRNRNLDKVRKICASIQPGANFEKISLEEVFSAYEIQSKAGWATDEKKKDAQAAIQSLKKRGKRGDALKFLS